MDVTKSLTDATMPTSAQISKGRAMLQKLLQQNQISPEGVSWLTFALDPFHDKEIKGVAGIPDGNTGKSVVCSVVQEVQIVCPVAFQGANWACRIATYPVASNIAMTTGYSVGSNINQSGIPTLMAPVVISYNADGQPFDDFNAADNATYLSIPSAYLKGPFKIGAMGVEVVNTTAVINRQGLCTAARMNQPAVSSHTAQCFPNVITQQLGLSLYPVRTVPSTLADMVLLTGNTAWPAEEGAYTVVALKNINDHNACSQPIYPMLMSDDFDAGSTSDTIDVATPTMILGPVPGLDLPSNPNILSVAGYPGVIPMDSSVLFFTGLSPQTTLTLRFRVMIERFPNDRESEIVVLATETAFYDPIALSIYSQVSQMMPAAVMFKENPEGEWWKRVLGTVADVVGSGLMLLPHPVAKAGGAALLTANKYFNPENAERKVGVKNGKQTSVKRNATKKKKPKRANMIPVTNDRQMVVYQPPSPPLLPKRNYLPQ